MARPLNKQQLLESGEENFNKLFALIATMSKDEQEQTFAFEDRDKNVRDVLVHLYEWHQLLLHWADSNRKGTRADFLPAPYNWKTYPQMNIGFRDKHNPTSLEKAVEILKESHGKTMALIDSFSDEQLFTKKYFPWTGTTSLGSYCVSATSSHYEWAIKKIKIHKKSLTA